MKKLFTLFGLGACLLVTSCSNEISSDERTQNFDTKGLTSFSTSSATKPASHLLTAGEYTGSRVDFTGRPVIDCGLIMADFCKIQSMISESSS